MAAPTTLTITFSGGTGSPITYTIPAGIDFRQALKNIYLAGGLWFVNSAGVEQYIPASEISTATAQ